MCGLALIWDKKKQLSDDPIRSMIDSLYHRGPDRNAFQRIDFKGGQVWLGHTQLKIMDHSPRSHQPISLNKKHLAYNGAIYNYKELGQKFFQDNFPSDTCFLSKIIAEEKIEKFKQFIGMYAMIWVDEENESIHLVRDQNGIKPLFYFENDDYLVVASELSALFSSGVVKKTLLPNAVTHYFKFKYAPKPSTFFKDVYEVNPGFIKTFSSTNSETEIGQKYVSESFDELLLDAVNQHLVTNEPVGLLLSGGIDSSLILACLQELGKNDINTFTIAHRKEDQRYGTKDGHYAQLATQLFGGNNAEYFIDASILTDLSSHVAHLDQPIADSGSLLNWFLNKKVSQTQKVVLSGAGADELFGGYNRLWAMHKVYPKMKGKTKLINSFSKTGLIKLLGSKTERLIQKLVDGYHENPKIAFSNFAGLYSESLTASQIPGLNEGPEDPLDWARWWDQNYYLPSDVLAMTDRMSMASSVEVRTPFLDQRICSFANGLSTESLLNIEPKGLLKNVLRDFGGEAIISRSKEGFGLPMTGWFRDDLIPLEQFKQGHFIYQYLNYDFVQTKISEHMSAKKDHAAFLWSLIIFEKWHQINF